MTRTLNERQPSMNLPADAKTWTTRADERAEWGPGPWDSEPDKVSWTDAATGRPCLIHRGPSGALCGYVAVDPGHALHGSGYWGVDVEVHGGLSYADRCQEADDESSGVCHVPAPGAPDDVWWFGFDCGHYRDLVPGHDAVMRRVGLTSSPLRNDGVYRDVDYVVGEVERLAKQLAATDGAS